MSVSLVHHMPAGPPLSSRIAAALARWGRLGLRRVLPLAIVTAAVAAGVLGGPIISGAVSSFTDPVALESSISADSSSGSSATGGSSSGDSGGSGTGSSGGPVQMGVDGAPAPQASPTAPSPAAEAPAAESPAAGAAGSSPVTEDPETAAAEEAGEDDRAETADDPAPAAAPEADPAPARAATAAAPADPSAEGQVLALVNQARAEAGCAPLVADAALTGVARAHSADMRDRDFFSHTNPEGLSPFDRAEQAGITYSRAENIAFGQPDAAAVMDAWMGSSGHRANILDCGLTRLGVGVAEGPGGPWWTQLFGD